MGRKMRICVEQNRSHTVSTKRSVYKTVVWLALYKWYDCDSLHFTQAVKAFLKITKGICIETFV